MAAEAQSRGLVQSLGLELADCPALIETFFSMASRAAHQAPDTALIRSARQGWLESSLPPRPRPLAGAAGLATGAGSSLFITGRTSSNKSRPPPQIFLAC